VLLKLRHKATNGVILRRIVPALDDAEGRGLIEKLGKHLAEAREQNKL
jgi:hypothetical protein